MPVIGGPSAPTPGVGYLVGITYSALNSAYPPRPAGLDDGLAVWTGPVFPSDAVAGGSGWRPGDKWDDAS